ncbi:MAG: VOC family protein [Myxococcales bacterium]|nr:VOC family protein [Myxococcales bacterium]MCB9715262.1 VOC family protein [Myxococcales bacterium]
MATKKESLGIKHVASLHLFVRDLERSLEYFVDSLDFEEIGRSTPDFEADQRARASVVQAGTARFVLMEPLGSRGESFAWLAKHPEGIGRIVFDVEDAERAYMLLTARGATSTSGLQHRIVEGGRVTWFDIATAFGDVLFRFVEHEGRTPIMPDLERFDPPRRGSNRLRFTSIDHITSNFVTLGPALLWMEHVMGLERYWDVAFHTQDVAKGHYGGTGLKSVVMWDPESGLKLANNEPAAPSFKASQIYLFCEQNRGPGVQHVALLTEGIVDAVRSLHAGPSKFMPTPGRYYDALPARLERMGIGAVEESLDDLRELQILLDGGNGKYLLQIFLQEASRQFGDPQAGPFFIELIERKGDPGFGAGNFRALFESIERYQESEGLVAR